MARNLGQRRIGEGGAKGIAAVWLLAVLTLLVGTPWLWWHGGVSEQVVDPRRIGEASGGTVYNFSAFAVSRAPLRSALRVDPAGRLRGFFFAAAGEDRDGGPPLLLLEDGHPLGPAVGSLAALRRAKGPAYYAFDRTVYFTTGDGSDPRRDGRTYSFAGYVRPRVTPLRVVVFGGLWSALVLLAVWSLRRRRELLEPRRSREAAPVLLLVAVFTAYAFFFSGLHPRVSVACALLMAGIATAALVAARRRLVYRPWMAWLLAFLLWSSIRLALDPDLTGSWRVVGLLWLTSSLGLVVWSALALSPRLQADSSYSPLVAFFLLVTAFVTLQSLGFDWKGEVLAWTGFKPLDQFRTLWNQKFIETWVLFLTWALALRLGVRRRGELLLVFAACASVSLTGYSHTVKVALVASLLVFLAARWRPRGTLFCVATVTFGLLFSMPILGSVGWTLYTRHAQVIHSRQTLSEHLAPRLLSWGYASDLVRMRPIAGWGPGSATQSPATRRSAIEVWPRMEEREARHVPTEMRNRRPLPGGHPHNLPLLLWIDTGLLGVLCVAGLLFTVFHRLYRLTAEPRLAPSLALFVAVGLVYLFNYPAFDPAPSFLLFVVAGLATPDP